MSSNMMMANNGGVSATGSNQPASQPAITLSTSALPQAVPSKLQKKAKRRRKCGLCGLHGHNRRTCKVKSAAKPKVKSAAKPKPAVAQAAKPKPAIAQAVKPANTPEFPGDVKYVQYLPVSIKSLKESLVKKKRVQANYKGGMQTYSAYVTEVDEKNYTVSLRYSNGETVRKVPFYRPFGKAVVACVTALSDASVTLSTGTNKYEVPVKDWPAEIIVYAVEVKCNAWERMDIGISLQVNHAYMRGEPEVKYSVGEFDYVLRFDGVLKGTQTNLSTKTSREVRLKPISKPPLPPRVLDRKKFPTVNMSDVPEKYISMLTSLQKGYRYRFYYLGGLGHKRFLELLVEQAKQKGESTRQKVLCHGTGLRVMQQILNGQGLQNAGTRNGKAFGEGVYLTSDMSYAADFATADTRYNRRVVLLCDVLVGNRMITNPGDTMLKPGFRSGGNGGDIVMKPWVNVVDIAFSYMVEITWD